MDSDLEEIETNLEDTSLNEDEEEQLTPAEVIQLLEETWLNEKFAPEILPHKMNVVDCILGQIKYMEQNIETVPNSDFKKSIHQMELDRLQFMVTSYLRCRLEKIETYASYIVKQETERMENGEELVLTESELQFAKDYLQGLEQLFHNIPGFHPGWPLEGWLKQPIMPNINSFVFLKSKVNVDGVIINNGNDDDGEEVDLTQGSQVIISYKSVSQLVKKGDVLLI